MTGAGSRIRHGEVPNSDNQGETMNIPSSPNTARGVFSSNRKRECEEREGEKRVERVRRLHQQHFTRYHGSAGSIHQKLTLGLQRETTA